MKQKVIQSTKAYHQGTSPLLRALMDPRKPLNRRGVGILRDILGLLQWFGQLRCEDEVADRIVSRCVAGVERYKRKELNG